MSDQLKEPFECSECFLGLTQQEADTGTGFVHHAGWAVMASWGHVCRSAPGKFCESFLNAIEEMDHG